MSKSFSYIPTIGYKGGYVRLAYYVGRTAGALENPNNPTSQPQHGLVRCGIQWSAYAPGGDVTVPPPVDAALGVQFSLQGQTSGATLRKIEGVFIDNSFNPFPCYIIFPDTGYMALCKAYSVTMVPALTSNFIANIFCEGFDGVNNPSTIVMFLDEYVDFFEIDATPEVTTEPSVVNFSNGHWAPTSNTISITLPTGLVGGNSLLVALFWQGTGGSPFTGWPADMETVSFSGGNPNIQIMRKVLTGSEGATITGLGNGRTNEGAYACIQVKDYAAPPEGSTVLGGTGLAPMVPLAPPSLTPSWGDAVDLVFAFAGIQTNGGGTITTPPDGFTTLLTDGGAGGIDNVAIQVATNVIAAATITPGIFGSTSNNPWMAGTVAYTNTV